MRSIRRTERYALPLCHLSKILSLSRRAGECGAFVVSNAMRYRSAISPKNIKFRLKSGRMRRIRRTERHALPLCRLSVNLSLQLRIF